MDIEFLNNNKVILFFKKLALDLVSFCKTCVSQFSKQVENLNASMTQVRCAKRWTYYYDIPAHYESIFDYKFPFYHRNVVRKVDRDSQLIETRDHSRNWIMFENGVITQNSKTQMELKMTAKERLTSSFVFAMLYDEKQDMQMTDVGQSLSFLVQKNLFSNISLELSALIPYLLTVNSLHIDHTPTLLLMVAQKNEEGVITMNQYNGNDRIEFA